MNISKKIVLVLLFDLIIFIFCWLGVKNLIDRAALPFTVKLTSDHLLINNHEFDEIPDGSILYSVAGIKINSLDALELVTDSFTMLDSVQIQFIHNYEMYSANIRLNNYYDLFYIYSVSITGLIFFILGIFVLLKLQANRVSTIFHWACICMAGIMMMSSGKFTGTVINTGYLTRILFHTAYLITPAIFLHFALIFPIDRTLKYRNILRLVYFLSTGLIIAINITFYSVLQELRDSNIYVYAQIFNIIRIFIIILIVYSVIVFFYSLLTVKGETERKKIKWILTGFLLGPVSFLAFWVIPILFGINPLVREEYIILINNAIPITFTIAIVKYHLLDIDYILNRSLVYGIVFAIMIGLYVSIILLLVNSFRLTDNIYISTVSIIIIAVLFMPVKQKVQNFVDTKFFRVKYNFRKAVNNVYNALKEFNDIKSLADYLISEIYNLIPVEKIGVFEINDSREYVRLIAPKNLAEFRRNQYRLNYSRLVGLKPEIITRIDKIEKEALVSTSFNKFLQRYNLVLIVPLVSESNEYFGWIVVGSKLSGQRFTLEDIDLIKSISVVASATLNRIALQEQLITERLLAAELEELNKQKSLYVSSVSHELKSPLTSIKLFAELILKDKELNPDKVKNHLNIIENETDRLSRLISNILDVSKIEKGTKVYQLKEICINRPVEELLSVIGLRVRSEGFSLITDLGKTTEKIMADEEAIKQAIENLINNSIRYSSAKKSIYIQTYCCNGFACIKVEDKGIGISESALQKICEPFYRESDDNTGLGLGLFIVKHIMDSHNGQIEINSTRGIGTTVNLKFPLIN